MSRRRLLTAEHELDLHDIVAVLRDHLGKADAYICAVEELLERPVFDDDDDADGAARRRNHVAHLIESTKLAVRAALCAGDELENRPGGA